MWLRRGCEGVCEASSSADGVYGGCAPVGIAIRWLVQHVAVSGGGVSGVAAKKCLELSELYVSPGARLAPRPISIRQSCRPSPWLRPAASGNGTARASKRGRRFGACSLVITYSSIPPNAGSKLSTFHLQLTTCIQTYPHPTCRTAEDRIGTKIATARQNFVVRVSN